MVVSLLFVIVLGAVVFFQTAQGLFSALIMCVFTVCCAALSLGTYEWVAIHWLAPFWKPDFAFALALTGTFGLPLIILWFAAQKLVRRACLLPGWMDRAGSVLCGLITGFTLVGVLAFALANVPFGGSLVGFQRIPMVPLENARGGGDVEPPDPKVKERNLLLKPDRFAVGLASLLSAGVFSGERGLADDNPDLVQATAWANAVPTMVSRYAPPKSISIVKTETVASVYRYTPPARRSNEGPRFESLDPASGQEFRMIRVALRNEARDAGKSHLFTIRQFRLVGTEGGDNKFTQYHPIAIQQPEASESVNRYIRYKQQGNKDWPVVDDPYLPRDDHPNEVGIVFELPKGFKPNYLEYKRGARADVKFVPAAPPSSRTTDSLPVGTDTERTASAETPSPRATTASDPSSNRRERSRSRETVADSGRGGNVRGFTTLVGESFFGNGMPLELKAYQKVRDVAVRRGELRNGQLHGIVAEQSEGRDRTISRFRVPDDQRLLQLNTGRLQTRSGIGKVLDLATRTVQNYVVEDAGGKRYKVIGKFAIADVNGQRMIEVQYFPEQAGTVGGLGAFRKIDETKLKDDYEYVLLFLVDPGAKIVSFSTGGDATRRDDLTGESLVAPD